jgi:DNA helicase-4
MANSRAFDLRQQYRLRVDDDQQRAGPSRVFWSRVELQTGDGEALSVDGLPNGQRPGLRLPQHCFARTTRGRKALFEHDSGADPGVAERRDALIDRGSAGRRWITHEQQQALLASAQPCPCRRRAGAAVPR